MKRLVVCLLVSLVSLVLFLSVPLSADEKEGKKVPKAEAMRQQTQACVGCHSVYTPGIVSDWLSSRHAHTLPAEAMQKPVIERRITVAVLRDDLSRVVVGCYECHGQNTEKHKDSFDHMGFRIHVVVSPNDCNFCHPVEVKEYSGSKKAHAIKNIMDILARGYGVSLVSGDGEKTTHEVARMVGISEALGGKLPQDKAAVIEELQRAGNRVAMVGDGINDAPALAQSDLAIALSTGNNLGREAADIMLMRGKLQQVLDFLHLARRVTTVVKVNLGASVIYNLISIPVAISGLLTPVIAVTAMVLSSLSITVSTLMFTKDLSRQTLRSAGR